MKVINRFKRLDLIDRVPKELWKQVYNTVQEAVTKTIPKKNKCNKAKWFSEKVLHIAEEKKRSKRQRRKVKIYQTECRVSENSKER